MYAWSDDIVILLDHGASPAIGGLTAVDSETLNLLILGAFLIVPAVLSHALIRRYVVANVVASIGGTVLIQIFLITSLDISIRSS